MATSSLIGALQQEIQQIDQTLRDVPKLRNRKVKLEGLLREYRAPSAAKIMARPAAKRAVKKAPVNGQMPIPGVAQRKPQGLTTMEMVRELLVKHGQPMSSGELHKAIVDSYGKVPASSLSQMLYKRARAGSTFYRTSEGKYGLMASSPQPVSEPKAS
jgi:hypothetical protein